MMPKVMGLAEYNPLKNSLNYVKVYYVSTPYSITLIMRVMLYGAETPYTF